MVLLQPVSEFPPTSGKAVRREAPAGGSHSEQMSASGGKWGLSCTLVTFPVGLTLQVAIIVPSHRGAE